MEEIPPNRDGDLSLGPLAPGCYGVCRGETVIGAFRLCGNAALGEAEGRLWTDGELLYLDSGTLTPVLKSLEAKGFVKRTRSSRDERVLLVGVTKEGVALREAARPVPGRVSVELKLRQEEVAALRDRLNGMLETMKGS